MKIVEQSFKILTPYQNEKKILEWWEPIARKVYKSENKICEGSALKLFNKLKYDLKHESVFEHINFTVDFTTNRGVLQELIRHRLISPTVESTRYNNYSKNKYGNQISIILPVWFENFTYDSIEYISDPSFHKWYISMKNAETTYFELLKKGQTPQQARGVLPIDLKTEIVVTTNIREWWHIFELRTALGAHPQIRKLMIGLLIELHENYPNLFPIKVLY